MSVANENRTECSKKKRFGNDARFYIAFPHTTTATLQFNYQNIVVFNSTAQFYTFQSSVFSNRRCSPQGHNHNTQSQFYFLRCLLLFGKDLIFEIDKKEIGNEVGMTFVAIGFRVICGN